jgi:hypothetical protein
MTHLRYVMALGRSLALEREKRKNQLTVDTQAVTVERETTLHSTVTDQRKLAKQNGTQKTFGR